MTEEIKQVTGLVLYCDGGARPTNPGWCGWGMHGYHYVAAPVTLKGLGLGDVYVTARGYKPKELVTVFAATDTDKYFETFRTAKVGPAEKGFKPPGVAVAVTEYVDAFEALGWESNNYAEMRAVVAGLKYLMVLPVRPDFVQILSDSLYVVKAMKEWLAGWEKANWVKRDGTPPAHPEIWKEIKKLRDQYVDEGGIFHIDHISAHEGHYGNEDADKMATMGLYQSMYKGVPSAWKISPPADYWKPEVDKHPFLYQKRCYFNTSPKHQEASQRGGVYRYHLGDHGPEDEMLGKRDSEVGYSVIRLTHPEQRIEDIKTMQASYSRNADSIFAVYLDTLFNPNVYKTISRFGTSAMLPPMSYRLDIKYYNDQPLTREWKPPMLSRRAADAVDQLDNLLDLFLAGDESLSVNNITAILYDVLQKAIKPKKGETEIKYETSTKLKSSLAVGLASLMVPIKHPNATAESPIADINITLSLGIDIPDRNTFKRLEDLNPEVFVISWKTSDYAFRYATVIKEGDNIGIWAGKDSNLRLLA